MVEGGMKCVKFLLFSFNLLFVLVAIGLIAAGAYVQVQLKDYFDLIGGSFSSAAALLIAVGVIIFFIAFFGCCGAYKENHTCVLIYAVFLVIIFILEIAGGIAGFVLRGKVEDEARKYMKSSMEKYHEGGVWDSVQKEFTCCGIDKPEDWNMGNNNTIPKSCCAHEVQNCTTTTSYKEGCLHKFTKWVEEKIYIVGAIGIAFAAIQIFGILFACCLARAIKKEYEVV